MNERPFKINFWINVTKIYTKYEDLGVAVAPRVARLSTWVYIMEKKLEYFLDSGNIWNMSEI